MVMNKKTVEKRDNEPYLRLFFSQNQNAVFVRLMTEDAKNDVYFVAGRSMLLRCMKGKLPYLRFGLCKTKDEMMKEKSR